MGWKDEEKGSRGVDDISRTFGERAKDAIMS